MSKLSLDKAGIIKEYIICLSYNYQLLLPTGDKEVQVALG